MKLVRRSSLPRPTFVKIPPPTVVKLFFTDEFSEKCIVIVERGSGGGGKHNPRAVDTPSAQDSGREGVKRLLPKVRMHGKKARAAGSIQRTPRRNVNQKRVRL
jgi:hypothetical protein